MENQNRRVQLDSNQGHGGARPGAGRRLGAATAKTRQVADEAARAGCTPLEFMLRVMRQEPAEGLDAKEVLAATMLRFEAAKAAAPYMHPRLSATELSGGLEIGPRATKEQRDAAVAAAMRADT